MNIFGLEPLVFLSDLFEHFQELYLKREGWIFCCELFESCPHSLIFAKYVYGWVFSEKKIWCGILYQGKHVVVMKAGVFLKAASRYLSLF